MGTFELVAIMITGSVGIGLFVGGIVTIIAMAIEVWEDMKRDKQGAPRRPMPTLRRASQP